jgi:hypothetical protein
MTTLRQTILSWLDRYGYAQALGRLQRAEARLGASHPGCIEARAALDRAHPTEARAANGSAPLPAGCSEHYGPSDDDLRTCSLGGGLRIPQERAP